MLPILCVYVFYLLCYMCEYGILLYMLILHYIYSGTQCSSYTTKQIKAIRRWRSEASVPHKSCLHIIQEQTLHFLFICIW